MALFQELVASGMTLILVTHEPDIAEHAGRVIEMRDGQIRSDVRHTPVKAVVPDAEEGDPS
jgi:putative ABC transport system ATP-binding protein